jgi:zinc D-Ala-D-Ala carboxypeptidase
MKKVVVLFALLVISVAAHSPQSTELSTEFIMGKFNPTSTANFVAVPKKYTDRADMYLQKEALAAFERMADSAKAAGVSLKIISSTRNFDYQKGIWERKWQGNKAKMSDKDKALKILEYSAMPGASRHHWGTDMDLNSLDNTYFAHGIGKKTYNWLTANASKYGFGQPYTAGRKTGYKEEKWHWSYLPLAKKYTDYAKTNLNNGLFSGFKGANTASDIDVVRNYVLGINNTCL